MVNGNPGDPQFKPLDGRLVALALSVGPRASLESPCRYASDHRQALFVTQVDIQRPRLPGNDQSAAPSGRKDAFSR